MISRPVVNSDLLVPSVRLVVVSGWVGFTVDRFDGVVIASVVASVFLSVICSLVVIPTSVVTSTPSVV